MEQDRFTICFNEKKISLDKEDVFLSCYLKHLQFYPLTLAMVLVTRRKHPLFDMP